MHFDGVLILAVLLLIVFVHTITRGALWGTYDGVRVLGIATVTVVTIFKMRVLFVFVSVHSRVAMILDISTQLSEWHSLIEPLLTFTCGDDMRYIHPTRWVTLID